MHPDAIAVVDPRATARLCLYAEQLHAAWRNARAAADREAAAERGFLTATEPER
jgi:hypothetical protein